MKRIVLVAISIFILGGVAFYLLNRQREGGSPVDVRVFDLFSSSSPNSGQKPENKKDTPATPATEPGNPAPNAISSENASPRFLQFLKTEALELNSTHIDLSAAEERLKKEADSMGAPEIAYAKALALNSAGNANQRVLAVALLAKASYSLALPALTEIITRASNSSRAEPHTVEEIQNTQAKAFAIMAVDSLAERAVKDRSAREELERLGRQAADSTVQKYIQERIRGLPPI